ncbi:MAG: hypothetical protein ACKVOE_07165 [Rickettsiales bacterium]
MRHAFAAFGLLAALMLGASPAHALLKNTPCSAPTACKKLETAIRQCAPRKPCTSLVNAVKALQAPTACQRAQSADSHAFSLCSKATQNRSFELLSHLSGKSAKRLFCSERYKNMITRRSALREQYTYAYAPYDPNSEDDEIGAEKPDFFATMTDCRGVK